ncbi:MAG: excinuclease ABC subunit UvrA [candidate division Zixibacteria bacterium]|nr:excinuclease ABC subunit UvrA [candidate division Zixibacteria bacterium]
MTSNKITIKGAREHNLKNIDINIPRNKLIVVTGLSGSGKSSLAFDTIYAEGQRRYVESLSAYARQFLGLMEKPDVDFIDGLSPAISIEQRTASKNPRSTVGTVTEIYDYLRLLYARIGIPHCWKCGKEIHPQSSQQIIESALELPESTRAIILAPVVRGRKGEHKDIFEKARKDGFVRVRVDGTIMELDNPINLDKNKKHNIEIVVDRLIMKPSVKARLADSVETALNIGEGSVIFEIPGKNDIVFSEHFACPDCGISFEKLEPRMFSFNSPLGACPECSGLGTKMDIDPKLVLPDPSKSINQGAIAPWGEPRGNWYEYLLRAIANKYGFTFSTPFEDLPERVRNILLFGSGDEEFNFRWEHRNGKGVHEHTSRFEGIIPHLARRNRQTQSSGIREWIKQFMSISPCLECKGGRLKKESLAVKIHGVNIAEITAMTVKKAYGFFKSLKLNPADAKIASQVSKEITQRLGFLQDVGLEYLTLDRTAGTLSGGEAQRIRLATQIGSRLVGVLYILDEPSIGLHQRDNRRLLNTLESLRDLGNTVIVVEHDKETIEAADYIIDLGPGAGRLGGKLVASGTLAKIKKSKRSITGQYLTGKKKIPIPDNRKVPDYKHITIKGAKGNNLKNAEVDIPIGLFTCVTGVSGSGKSTLINETLYRAAAQKIYHSKIQPLPHDEILGLDYVDKVIDIDQSPIGRTPRSNPATYTGLFAPIRDIFSKLPESRLRGYGPGRFSFNVKGGRCEDCEGDGIKKIEMHFLPDIYIQCETCKGKRYNRETLEIAYRGKSIADILEMTVDEALEFFENIEVVKRKLVTLKEVGLGYIHLGQQATTLSGGEAQRVKLSTELSKVSTGNTLYILDEPTTGLHFEDIKMLLNVLNKLVARGNTVVVIEHNLDVIKTADWIIDLGPEGGDEGGYVVASGTPEHIAANDKSYTGAFLKKEPGLKPKAGRNRKIAEPQAVGGR